MASSPKFIATDGADFEVVALQRGGSATEKSSLKVNGATGQVTREGNPVLAGNPFVAFIGLGADASGAAQDLPLTGAKVGDKVVFAHNLTDLTNAASAFESTISKAGSIRQLTTDLSAKKVQILLVSQS